MKKFLLTGAMLMVWIGMVVSACNSPNSVGPLGESYMTTVSGLQANVQGGVSGCTFSAYDKDTNKLTYVCVPPTCSGTCFDGSSQSGVKSCTSSYNAQTQMVSIVCGCMLECKAPADEPAVEPVADQSSEPQADAGMVDAGSSDSASEPTRDMMQDAGMSDAGGMTDGGEKAPEISMEAQNDITPPQCAADEVLVTPINHCVKKIFFDFAPQTGNEWLIHWSKSVTGEYFMWRGLVQGTAMSCTEDHTHTPADIDTIQFRCKTGTSCMSASSTRVSTQTAMFNGKMFYYVKVIAGGEEATMLHLGSQNKRAWPFCQKYNATKFILATTRLGSGADPWFQHMP